MTNPRVAGVVEGHARMRSRTATTRAVAATPAVNSGIVPARTTAAGTATIARAPVRVGVRAGASGSSVGYRGSDCNSVCRRGRLARETCHSWESGSGTEGYRRGRVGDPEFRRAPGPRRRRPPSLGEDSASWGTRGGAPPRVSVLTPHPLNPACGVWLTNTAGAVNVRRRTARTTDKIRRRTGTNGGEHLGPSYPPESVGLRTPRPRTVPGR